MVAKLVIFLLVLAIILALVVYAAFLYFDRRGEREHEKELREMEYTEKMLSDMEDDPIDRELERERNG